MTTKAQTGTDALLKDIKIALANGSAERATNALRALLLVEPVRWREMLLIHGGVKDPQSREPPAAFEMLSQAALAVANETEFVQHTDELVEFCLGSTSFLALFYSVRKALEDLTFFEQPYAVQVFRLLAFLESQWLLGREELFKKATTSQGSFDTHKALATMFENEHGVKVSMDAALEGLIDCVELQIRYAQHTTEKPTSLPPLHDAQNPYGDADFDVGLRLAHCWRVYEDAWTRFKFLGWRIAPTDNTGGALLLQPTDPRSLIRYEVGTLRDVQYMLEFWANTQQSVETETTEERKRLEESITIPLAGREWDGFVDLLALHTVTTRSSEAARAELWIEAKHYTAAVATLRIEGPRGSVTWPQWLEAVTALRQLSDAIHGASRTQVNDGGGDGCLRLPLVVHRDTLTNVLAAATRLDAELCSMAIGALTFDATRKSLEIYDQPLLPVSKDHLILSPCLISAGSPSRAIENFLAQWEDTSNQNRGAEFEDAIASIFSACGGVVARRVCFPAADGKDIEYDIVVWWDGYLLICECKFLRGIHSPAETWRAGKEVEHALVQLERQKRVALQQWRDLVAAAPTLSLSFAPPAAERVICIAVTSISQFTGPHDSDRFVIDERCLSRFFQDRQVAAMAMDPGGVRRRVGVLGEIRRSDDFHVEEFLEYLAAPTPVTLYEPGMKLTVRPLPLVRRGDPKVLVATTEFVAREFNYATDGDPSQDIEPG